MVEMEPDRQSVTANEDQDELNILLSEIKEESFAFEECVNECDNDSVCLYRNGSGQRLANMRTIGLGFRTVGKEARPPLLASSDAKPLQSSTDSRKPSHTVYSTSSLESHPVTEPSRQSEEALLPEEPPSKFEDKLRILKPLGWYCLQDCGIGTLDEASVTWNFIRYISQDVSDEVQSYELGCNVFWKWSDLLCALRGEKRYGPPYFIVYNFFHNPICQSRTQRHKSEYMPPPSTIHQVSIFLRHRFKELEYPFDCLLVR